MTITDEMVERAARSNAAFDGRDYDAMSRHDRERYLARARTALTAALEGREEPDATAAYMAGFERGKEAATAEERERCAVIAEQFNGQKHAAHDMATGIFPKQSYMGDAIAAAIRGGADDPR